MINDISGGVFDPEILKVAAEMNVPICLMHTRGTPETMSTMNDYSEFSDRSTSGMLPRDSGVVSGVMCELETVVVNAMKAGVKRWNIIVDPGIGFAKGSNQNLSIFKNLKDMFHGGQLQGFPILVGPSRKKFISRVLGTDDLNDRIWGTAAAVSACVAGIHSLLF
jgi:dihydropteroate synthase